MKTPNENQRPYLLWIENEEDYTQQLNATMTILCEEHDCQLHIVRDLASAKAFIQEHENEIALVLLDLDIPVGNGVATAAEELQGLNILMEHGHLPVIVLTQNEDRVDTEKNARSPLAWITKSSDRSVYTSIIGETLAMTKVYGVGRKTPHFQQRTLACVKFLMQDYSLSEALPSNPIPWEVIGLNRGIELLSRHVKENGGRIISVAGASVFCEFPEDTYDPDHFRSAMYAMQGAWHEAYGERRSLTEFNHYYVPYFCVGFLPNHVDVVDRLPGAPHPELHALGRPGEIVRYIARGLGSGEMGVIADWLEPGSPEDAAWQSIPTNETTLANANIRYIRGGVKVLKKDIPRTPLT